MRVWICVFLFSCALPCAAQDAPALAPKAAITDLNGNPVNESFPLGEAVYLSAKQSQHAGKPGSVRWIIKPQARADRAGIFDSGMTVCIPTGQKPVVLEVTQVVTQGDVIDVATLSITLGEAQPVVPDVTPNPPPNIVERLGLVTASVAGKRRVVSPEPGRSQEAAAIAKAHRDAVAAAKQNPFGLINALEGDLSQRVGAALDVNARLRWKPWQDSVTARQAELLKAGQLTTRDNWLEAYEEIATGLERGN